MESLLTRVLRGGHGEGGLLLWENTGKQKPHLLFPEGREQLGEWVSIGKEEKLVSRKVPGEAGTK